MTPENFCYWLKGYFEISEEEGISYDQSVVIMDHLDLVFEKKTPIRVTEDITIGGSSPPPKIPRTLKSPEALKEEFDITSQILYC